MKYIRTQAGVYEVKNGKFLRNWNLDVEKYSRNFPARFADNIEELCDEFVMINDYCFTKPQIIDFIDLDMYKGETIYGAIWNDEGLIYVAKMNEKGEFELL